jgi:hypothetical protein
MRGCLLLLVILGFVVGIFVAFVPFLVPEVATAMDPFICPGDETVTLRQRPSYRGGVNISFECVGVEGASSEPAFIVYLVLFMAWCWIPIVPFILLLLSGGLSLRSRLQSGGMIITLPSNLNSGGTPIGGGNPFGGSNPSNLSLKDRLQQLEDAYNAGLLTREQYDQAKQNVLDSLSRD